MSKGRKDCVEMFQFNKTRILGAFRMPGEQYEFDGIPMPLHSKAKKRYVPTISGHHTIISIKEQGKR